MCTNFNLFMGDSRFQVQRELTLGRRVGFYRFKSDLGAGNFSKVKLATHLLTKGKEDHRQCYFFVYYVGNCLLSLGSPKGPPPPFLYLERQRGAKVRFLAF